MVNVDSQASLTLQLYQTSPPYSTIVNNGGKHLSIKKPMELIHRLFVVRRELLMRDEK